LIKPRERLPPVSPVRQDNDYGVCQRFAPQDQRSRKKYSTTPNNTCEDPAWTSVAWYRLPGTLSGGRRLIFLPIGTVLFQFSADRAWGSTQGSRNRSHRRPVPHHQHDRSVARSSGLKKWLYEFFHRNILPQQVLRSILARALQVFPFCNITLQESKLINWNLPSPRKRVSKKEYSI